MLQTVTLVPVATTSVPEEGEFGDPANEQPLSNTPSWLDAVPKVFFGVLVVLLLLYWTGRLQAKQVVAYGTWVSVASIAIFSGWWFGSGAYKTYNA